MNEKQERRKFIGSLIIPLFVVTAMWLTKLAEACFDIDLGKYGVVPHTLTGLVGILTMPFLHGGWEHLIANTVPIMVLGTALFYFYPSLSFRVLLITYLASGLFTWCIGSPTSTHIGASALVYGLNLFLIASGFIRGNRSLIVISLIMVFLYGSFFWGMIPSLAIPQNISWEGHLAGALIGVLLSIIYRKEGPQKEEHYWDDEDDEDDKDEDPNPDGEKPYWDVPTPSDEELTVVYRVRH